ncbi:uncharacterized protein MYCFIDRAFT_46606 [Pseudocercospora fijiensis CIRAD86]|uniref:EXPERA domain-containing protein n=1 Tax=Pseudocercospora fijiensis (strain CIRAD86) TaxID=383855 RepID=M3B7B0_PSEFD|nr:uncharacterized protein MYCFIDRAFT_46606 [Pseudocercospora fijiensis CIRAD86]EME85202.1 hypothetical protein MYCFIDRAFT_46606 [Pseudocercospora fijiensis CIRAD86]
MAPADPPSFISTTTILSLLSTVFILALAYLTSLLALPKTSTPTKTRLLFIWHAFDALIHLILEGGYLYNCFFSYRTLTTPDLQTSAYLPPKIYFLGRRDRIYGSEYGTNALAKLWMEYAKADARWGGSDLTIVSLEILTVFVMAPLGVYVCDLLRKKGREKEAYFWMVVVATGELYGGFMTFAPEWLTGNPNLDASNWMYLWLYLVFFNAALWVLIPLWVIYEAHGQLSGRAKTGVGKKVE